MATLGMIDLKVAGWLPSEFDNSFEEIKPCSQ